MVADGDYRPPTRTVRDYTAAFNAPIWVHKMLRREMPWGRVDVGVVVLALPVFMVSAVTLPLWWPLFAAGDAVDKIFTTFAGLVLPALVVAVVAHYTGIRIRKFPRAGLIAWGVMTTQFRGPLTENRKVGLEPRIRVGTYARAVDMRLRDQFEDGTR